MMSRFSFLLCILVVFTIFIHPGHARSFYSRDSYIRTVISSCSSPNSTTGNPPSCHLTLHCILNAAPVEYSARWSAGASILAFIPTIVGLMSNSIEEIGFIAEDNVWLALLLSFSSTTAFVSRFSERGVREEDGRWYHREHVNGVAEHIAQSLRRVGDSGARRRAKLRHQILLVLSVVFLAVGGGATWYLLSWVIRYGVVVSSCPTSIHVAVWAGLSQAIIVCSVLLRRFSVDTITIQHLSPMSGSVISNARGNQTKQNASRIPSHKTQNLPAQEIVLRCPRDNAPRWVIQTAIAVLSFALYTFGTVVLASMTMFPASDAIRVMVVCSSSAGMGRLIGFWAMTSARSGERIIVMNVPKQYMHALKEKIEVDEALRGMNERNQ